MPGAVEPDFQIVASGRAPHLGAEQALDLPARQIDMVGDLDQRQRLGEIRLHQFDDGQHLGILHAETGAQRQALAVGRAAHAVGQNLFANAVDEALVEIVADQLQHHVKRRGAAGAGVDVLIDLEEVGKDIGFRKRFGEAWQVLPVDGASLVGQEARRGEDMRAGAKPADRDAAVVFLAQPGEGRLVVVALDIDAAADDSHVRPIRPGHLLALFLERGVDGAFDAVRGAHRLAVDAGQAPAVGLVAEHPVGRAQRVERRREGDHGEVGDEEEYKRSLDRMLYGIHGKTSCSHDANRMSRTA